MKLPEIMSEPREVEVEGFGALLVHAPTLSSMSALQSGDLALIQRELVRALREYEQDVAAWVGGLSVADAVRLMSAIVGGFDDAVERAEKKSPRTAG